MKELKTWIFQDDDNLDSWILHVIAIKERLNITADVEIYADYLPTEDKRMILKDIPISKNDEIISEIGRIVSAYNHPLNSSDVTKIKNSLKTLKQNFLD